MFERLTCAAVCVALLAGCPGKPAPAPKKTAPKKTTRAVPDPSATGAAAVVAQVDKAKIKACLMAVLEAAKMYRVDHDKAPTSAKVLLDAGLIKKEQAIDPWGNPYVIVAKGPTIDVVTYGADKKPGGAGPDTDWSTKDMR